MFGYLIAGLILHHMVPMDTGYIQIMAGHGILIIPGDGPRFIMALGAMMIFTGGIGYPAMFGALHG